MERRGLHLDGAERAVIFAEHRRGASQREIARLLGRFGRQIGVRVLSAGRPARLCAAAVALPSPTQTLPGRGAVARRLASARHIPLVARADRRDTLSHAPR